MDSSFQRPHDPDAPRLTDWKPPVKQTEDWYEEERSILEVILTELQRLKRRLKANPLPTLLFAVLMTSCFVKRSATKPKIYEANIILRVSETSLNDDTVKSPLPNYAIQDYIYNWVLNKKVVMDNIVLRTKDQDEFNATALVVDPLAPEQSDDEAEDYEFEADEIKAEEITAVRLDRGALMTGGDQVRDDLPLDDYKYPMWKDAYDSFGPEFAVEEFRGGLSIGVHRNYFLFNSYYEDTPRSLRLVITYYHQDAEFAFEIASLLADLVIETEAAKRLSEVTTTAQSAVDALDQREQMSVQRQLDLNAANFQLVRAQDAGDTEAVAAATLRIDQLNEELDLDEIELPQLRIAVERLTFQQQLEENEMAYVWEVAEEVKPEVLPPPGPIRLAVLAVLCFSILFPVGAIAFGTFNSKIHESEDVTRLGMPIVGHIPAFKGDKVGSLKSRGALKRRGIIGHLFKNRRMRDNRVA